MKEQTKQAYTGRRLYKFRVLTQPTRSNNNSKNFSTIESFKRKTELPLMNDDFKNRKIIYEESFIKKKHRIMKLSIGVTEMFLYLTLHNPKTDTHFKLRLMIKTGSEIVKKMKELKRKYGDTIFQNEEKKWYFSAPFPPWERKFYFSQISPSKVQQPNSEYDSFISEEIKKIDRNEMIFGS